MSTYQTDYYSWTQEQATLLREGRLNELDIEHLIEELEDMGKSRSRALESQLARLLAHLLKWAHQPDQRQWSEHSWRASIRNARLEVEEILEENPGLRPSVPDLFRKAYRKGLNWAIAETNLPEATFPQHCPWELSQVLDAEFWPG